VEKYQKELDKWFKENSWKYWSPHEITVRLLEECGEFAKVVNHVWGPKKMRVDEKKLELEEEIGDIIYTLICFANSNGISLDKTIEDSFKKVIKRDKSRYKKD
jgi:NTP pyrophosphatase (non-canonical NTP hydrolase)